MDKMNGSVHSSTSVVDIKLKRGPAGKKIEYVDARLADGSDAASLEAS